MTASLVGGIPDASRAAFEADRWIRQIARSEGEEADRDTLARPQAGRAADGG
jgi:hypothetical protein